ncbi:hypothetical protein EI77_02607 [Prosthecobacter fusiformis]|uniref:Uncharacterized protein n=1 Tax=Prosthecobacter fusiformis TaxID=48464 RepID=A0A4R7RXH0_9BACT|nr:hypothetical protein [Prosthecobacter fusiformis]TDU70562.1 hypothetical protein EI77_02607 [Prosthecobacter fusiformis]
MKGFIMIILELFEPPDGGPYTQFFMGRLIPGVISLYVLIAILIVKTALPIKSLPTIGGLPGVLVAFMYLGVAGLLHFHFTGAGVCLMSAGISVSAPSGHPLA